VARWLRLQLNGGEIEGRRLLSPAAFRETHTLQMPIPAAPRNDEEFTMAGYALGWAVGTYRGRRLVWHNGGIDGFYTEFMLLPDDGIAVATCNNAGLPISLTLARTVADRLLGVDGRDWGAHLREQRDKAKDAAASAKPKVAEGTTPSHPLADFAGAYEHPGYGTIRFTVEDGALKAAAGELELVSNHRHYDTWDLSLNTMAEVSLSATFYTDPSGAVSEVILPLEETVEPIRFRRQADAELADPDYLGRLAGTYDGAVRLEVAVSPAGKLLVTQSGQQAELVPAGGLAFTVAGMPGLRLEFELDANGRGHTISTQGVTLTRVG
jgi:hypothetical protein